MTAQLALCAARLSRRDDALRLARRAAAQDTGMWGAFVPAVLASAYALADDATTASKMMDETLDRLRLQSHTALPGQIENISRTWSQSPLEGIAPLVTIVREIDDAYVRADALGKLASTVGSAATPSLLNLLIDEASAIGEIWPRAGALQALVVPAATSKDRGALLRLLDLASALDNGWARGEVIGALASGVAPLADDDLLNRILSKASGWSIARWTSVAALAQTSTILFSNGQHAQARPLAQRALTTAKTTLEADSVELVTFDAKRPRATQRSAAWTRPTIWSGASPAPAGA